MTRVIVDITLMFRRFGGNVRKYCPLVWNNFGIKGRIFYRDVWI